MVVVITAWALDSYLCMKHDGIFTEEEFDRQIKPDVFLLADYPYPPKFRQAKFWSPTFSSSYKMKWHQVGNGRVQLRLPVYVAKKVYLCQAYIKKNDKYEKRQLAKFKVHRQLIQEGRHRTCGVLK